MSPDAPSTAEAALREMRWLRGLALRLVRDEHAAADVVQDTTDPDGSFELSLEAGVFVDLVATPPPTDAPFYRFEEVDPALGTTLPGVEAGTRDLLLSLP